MNNTVTTFLTFKEGGEEATNFYVSHFKNSKIHHIVKHPDNGTLLHAAFTLNGREFMAMDADDHFTFTDGISLFVDCKDQAEVDHYWEKLTENGGEAGYCGWLTDKFGVSWQVVPHMLGELIASSDPDKARRVMQAIYKMRKLDIAGLQAAYDGK